jgi:hypothetical protein
MVYWYTSARIVAMMEIMKMVMDVLLNVKLKMDGDVSNKEGVYVPNSHILLFDRLIC